MYINILYFKFVFEFQLFIRLNECKSKNYEINSSKYVKLFLLLAFVRGRKNTSNVQEKAGQCYRLYNSKIKIADDTD